MEAAIEALQAKASALQLTTEADDRVERFLKAAAGPDPCSVTPAINVLLADVDEHPETTVGDLLAS